MTPGSPPSQFGDYAIHISGALHMRAFQCHAERHKSGNGEEGFRTVQDEREVPSAGDAFIQRRHITLARYLVKIELADALRQ